MPVVLNLPPLKPDRGNTVVPPASAGVWAGENVNLDSLADSFNISDDSKSLSEQQSIPDVWAQFQIFSNAFAAKASAMHAGAITEWRALMALLALAAEHKNSYEISIRSLNFAPRQRAQDQSLFRNVLSYLLPEKSFRRETINWSRPALLFVREKLTSGMFGKTGPERAVGLLNPATLVAPGKVAATELFANIPWLADQWRDPVVINPKTGLLPLTSRDYAILAHYLRDLLTAIDAVPTSSTEAERTARGALRDEVADFGEACEAAAAGMQHPLEKCDLEVPSDLHPFFANLLKTRKVKAGGYENGGDTQLRMRDDLTVPRPFEGLLLLDDDLRKTLKRNDTEIRIWRDKMLSELKGGALSAALREANDAGFAIVQPDDFFTDELVLLKDDTDIQGHIRGRGFESAVMPFSPLLLAVMTPEEIATSAKLESKGENNFEVSISLPLVGTNVPHRIVRTFTLNAAEGGPRAVVQDDRPVGVGVWPDFRHPSWRWYFLRFENDPNSVELQTRFGLSGSQFVRDLNTFASPPDRARRLRDWLNKSQCAVDASLLAERVTPEDRSRPSQPLQRLRFVDQPRNRREIHIASEGFEAICMSKRPNESYDCRPVGFVLMPRKTAQINDAGQRIVAVDFGSTNTVAAVDQGLNLDQVRADGTRQGSGQIVTVHDRVVFPISAASAAGADAERILIKWSFMDFMPLGRHDLPTPTVALTRLMDSSEDAGLQRVAAGLDDRPLFSESEFFMVEERGSTTLQSGKWLGMNLPRLRFGLKWSKDDKVRRVTGHFLRQIIMMISAEMYASGLNPAAALWRFSYPEAMPPVDKQSLEKTVHDSWANVFVTGEGFPNPNPGKAVQPFITEGGAAANWFVFTTGADANAGPLAIILDIGGSTTDVAIWSNRKVLRWRNSFRIAGGDFLTNYMVNNAEIFDKLELSDLANLLREISDGRSSSVIDRKLDVSSNTALNFGELLFSDKRFQKSFDSQYAMISGTPVGAGLRVCATVALAGLVFYIGKVVKGLLESGALSASDIGSVSFAFGGRGSQFFRQLAGSDLKAEQSQLQNILKVFFDAVGLPNVKGPARIQFSPQPKMEVVLGMLGNRDTLEKTAKQSPESDWIPAGEIFCIKNEHGEVMEVPETSGTLSFLNASLNGPPELKVVKKFLRSVATHCGINIDLKETSANGAGRTIAEYAAFKLESEISRIRDESESTLNGTIGAFEPPFISALRALIDQLGQDVKGRAARMRVTE